jgi:hypothetical protein
MSFTAIPLAEVLASGEPEGKRKVKRVTAHPNPGQTDADAEPDPDDGYSPPSVTYLGTLHELTQGGVSGPDDGVGGAGGIGSV